MYPRLLSVLPTVSMLLASGLALAQEAAIPAAAVELSAQQPVPALVRSQGDLPQHAGEKLVLQFAVYAQEGGREPLWSEEQLLQLGPKGEYTVQLGAGSAMGLPQALFVAGEPRWLAVSAGDREESRTLLTSVPYAMKAADADTLAGQPAVSFVTQQQLTARLSATAAALTAQAAQPLLAGTVTGSGTTNVVPLWISPSVLGNSALFQTGSGATAKIGIAINAPATKLDVNGATTMRGKLNLLAPTATAAAGSNSPALQFSASSFKSGGSAITQNFQWQALPTGNNTASPAAALALLFGAGAANPSATGLSIAPNGVISFAPGQKFPSTATDFPKGATFDAESFMNGSSTDWMLVATNTGAGKGTILGQAVGTSTGIEGASPGGIGVEGVSDTGAGVFAVSNTTGIALQAVANGTGPAGTFWSQTGSASVQAINKGGGAALSASALTGYGGYFTNNATYSATVYASNAGNGNAGSFNNNSSSRVALAGINASTDGAAIGTYGNASNGKAVYGISTTGNGVYGTSTNGVGVVGNSTAAAGVAGYSSSNSGTYGNSNSGIGAIGISASNYGVNGISTSGTGVFGQTGTLSHIGALTIANFPAGVFGDGGQSNISAGVTGTADGTAAGTFYNDSADTAPVYSYNYYAGGPNAVLNLFQASSPAGTCGFGGAGNLSCTGQLKSLVDAGGGTRKVETYAMQSPENWLEDFGSGSLRGGVATVAIDSAFAETVSQSADYHVFLTPRGDSKGLYVTNVTATGFEVRESGGGKSSLAFDYRIVAKRRGYESQRLVDVTEKLRAETHPAHRR